MSARYDRIGVGYARTRREDPRYRAAILRALGSARSVVNVGAGTGSYEPRDRRVIAVEPSRVMAGQRPLEFGPAVRATAGALPLRDHSVDAAMALLSVHHWDDEQEGGVRELRRVAREAVIVLTIDPVVSGRTWLVTDYFPELGELDRRIFPPLDRLERWLGGTNRIEVLETHRDSCDWNLLSFWAHPERVLDARARDATSGFARMPAATVERVVAAVSRDLKSGEWDSRHGHLRQRDSLDVGLRLLVNHP